MIMERSDEARRKSSLFDRMHSKDKRIKELKIECGQQATKICVLNLRIKELEKAMRDVCNLINKKSTVSKWKIFNWLNKTLEG